MGLFMTAQNHVKKITEIASPFRETFENCLHVKNYTIQGINDPSLKTRSYIFLS
jgi:hypothetical protein